MKTTGRAKLIVMALLGVVLLGSAGCDPNDLYLDVVWDYMGGSGDWYYSDPYYYEPCCSGYSGYDDGFWFDFGAFW